MGLRAHMNIVLVFFESSNNDPNNQNLWKLFFMTFFFEFIMDKVIVAKPLQQQKKNYLKMYIL